MNTKSISVFLILFETGSMILICFVPQCAINYPGLPLLSSLLFFSAHLSQWSLLTRLDVDLSSWLALWSTWLSTCCWLEWFSILFTFSSFIWLCWASEHQWPHTQLSCCSMNSVFLGIEAISRWQALFLITDLAYCFLCIFTFFRIGEDSFGSTLWLYLGCCWSYFSIFLKLLAFINLIITSKKQEKCTHF